MDGRIKEYVFPKRIVLRRGKIDGAENLLVPCDLQIGLSEERVASTGGNASVVLDFGCEMHGGIRILTHTAEEGQAAVHIRLGESVSECCAHLGEKGACNDHSPRDIRALLPSYSDLEFLQTGFRFARIDFPAGLRVKAVVAVSVMRNVQPKGSFRCSDERVNEIFEVAARTLALNMQTYLWDGIKRDRLVWVGDMHPESLGVSCLYGPDPIVEDSLAYCAEHTPRGAWMNGLPTYTAWWLIIAADCYWYSGNHEFIERHAETVLSSFAAIDSLVAEDGRIGLLEASLFDWPSHGSEDEEEGIRSLLCLAAKKTGLLFSVLGMDTAPCDRLAARLEKKSDAVGIFKQCEAFAVYAGRRSAKSAYAFLTERGAHGFSTFMSYYLLSAIADGGGAQKALELMKEYYGGMLDLGATSFWEDFDLDWMENASPIDRLPKKGERDIHGDFGKFCYKGFRHSLCHGWSCGCIPFLMRKLAGIEITQAGCRKMRIAPVSAGLEWYEIAYPVPQGTVEIRFKKGKSLVKTPNGVLRES